MDALANLITYLERSVRVFVFIGVFVGCPAALAQDWEYKSHYSVLRTDHIAEVI